MADDSGKPRCWACDLWKQLAALQDSNPPPNISSMSDQTSQKQGQLSSHQGQHNPAAAQPAGGQVGGKDTATEALPAQECWGCRLTGLALGVGGGGYVAWRLFEQPYPRGMHRATLIGVSGGLFALGVARALGF